MKVEYGQYVKENRARFIIETLTLEGLGRLPSGRRRDQEEEILLTYLDSLRWKRLEKEGKVIYLGNRTYKVRI